MNYNETIQYLYSQTPQFQQIGAAAYKPGLDTVKRLATTFGNPQSKFPTIHIAGTNGKGSTAHTIAAVLQSAGYTVGLFTSPHLIDFRERIRINGAMIPCDEVCDFVERYLLFGLDDVKPSFFELTTIMAFDWFAKSNVDVAVIEVGLGGRLDSTNIIMPIMSVITNISFDHTAQLGNTLESIAFEKAGIIKPNTPVVIGEASGNVRTVFNNKAKEVNAPIFFAEDEDSIIYYNTDEYLNICHSVFGELQFGLTGDYQHKNVRTILKSLTILKNSGWKITAEAVSEGLKNVTLLTGLSGRWMRISEDPLTICDTGHNIGGWEYLSRQLKNHNGQLWIILGFVNDKDISHILPLMPTNARYIFTRASVPRAMPAEQLAEKALQTGLKGCISPSVMEAYDKAITEATTIKSQQNTTNRKLFSAPMIFVGGSTFVVADLLSGLSKSNN